MLFDKYSTVIKILTNMTNKSVWTTETTTKAQKHLKEDRLHSNKSYNLYQNNQISTKMMIGYMTYDTMELNPGEQERYLGNTDGFYTVNRILYSDARFRVRLYMSSLWLYNRNTV